MFHFKKKIKFVTRHLQGSRNLLTAKVLMHMELKEAQCVQTMCCALSSPLMGGEGEFTTDDLFKCGHNSSGSLA